MCERTVRVVCVSVLISPLESSRSQSRRRRRVRFSKDTRYTVGRVEVPFCSIIFEGAGRPFRSLCTVFRSKTRAPSALLSRGLADLINQPATGRGGAAAFTCDIERGLHIALAALSSARSTQPHEFD